MSRSRARWALPIALLVVFAFAAQAVAAVTFGSQIGAPGFASPFSWNYSNSMESTGSGGTFKLHEAFASDNSLPQGVYYTNSADGAAWSAPLKLTGAGQFERPGLAAADSTVVVTYTSQTSYNAYDPAAPRVAYVKVSTTSGTSFGAQTALSPANERVDYPIVGAAETSTGATNAYIVWADANSGQIKFRQSTNNGAWSSAINLGSTTADAGDGEGLYGYPTIAATDDLISVAWISNNKGVVKGRGIDLNGNDALAATAANWGTTTSLGKIPLKTNGYPIASSSPSDTGRVTVALNTATQGKIWTWNGTAWSSVVLTTWAAPYVNGYSIAAEPTAGGGLVVAWAGCRDTGVACNYNKKTARIDMMFASSSDGTTFSAPQAVVDSTDTASKNQRINDAPSIVHDGTKTYLQYNGWVASYAKYRVFVKVGTGSL